ncbi:MAG: hypothetical protein RLZZ141_937, partial [Pseudomonadota bacterium]
IPVFPAKAGIQTLALLVRHCERSEATQ